MPMTTTPLDDLHTKATSVNSCCQVVQVLYAVTNFQHES